MKNKFIAESLEELFEVYGFKDMVRMQDIKTKSAGDHAKEISLAQTQAAIIRDAGKAKARSEAAEEVFGEDSDIANIFNDRAIELGGNYVKGKASRGALAPVTGPVGKGEKLEREFKKKYLLPSERVGAVNVEKPNSGGFSRGGNSDTFAKIGIGRYANPPEMGGKRLNTASVASIGSVDLGSGESKYFNVKENNSDSTAEVWEDGSGRYKLVITAGDKPTAKLNDFRGFRNDQTWQPISKGYWTLVDYVPIKDLTELVRIYGKSSLMGYVYK